MALDQDEMRQVEQIAELAVRQYFDHYLTDVFPQQVRAIREHTHLMVERHDQSDRAHGSVERRFNRLVWLTAGMAAAGGTGLGMGLKTLLAAFGG